MGAGGYFQLSRLLVPAHELLCHDTSRREPNMCDEAKLKEWASKQLTRRSFGIGSGAAALAACAPAPGGASEESSLTEQAVTFATPDGTMDAILYAGSKPAPAVIFWPDIAGIRDAKKMMARRVAESGFTVLLVNPYYRDVAGQQFEDFAEFFGNDGFPKVAPWREKFTADAVMRDATAIVDYLDGREEVDTARGMGTQGYCMTGPFTLWTAASRPDRVKAAASFHGGGLVQPDNPKSPHRLMGGMSANLLLAIAQDDDAKAPEEKDVLREAAQTAGRNAMIEVFPGDHGWTVPDSPAYAKEPAEKAWANLQELYGKSL